MSRSDIAFVVVVLILYFLFHGDHNVFDAMQQATKTYLTGKA